MDEQTRLKILTHAQQVCEAILEASVLDIGTGTGGNLVGLLTALVKHCPNLKTVNVNGFEGNTLAIETARSALESFASQAPFTIDLSVSEQHIESLDDLPSPEYESYDFITTFKVGGEIISRAGGGADDFYHRFLTVYTGQLSDIGLLVLLDVTTKPDHTEFYPQLLNEQVSRFVRSQKDFVTLVPVPCHLYETGCTESCFTQKEFLVSHRLASNNRSRVAYRILAHKAFAGALHGATQADAGFVIGTKPADESFNICTHSPGSGIPLDGFRINT